MGIHLVRRTLDEIERRQSLPQLLASAYQGLEVIEYALRELLFLDPLCRPPHCSAVHRQAARARGDLARAPAFPWPIQAPPPVLTLALADEDAVVNELANLAEHLVLALVEASAQATDTADRKACITAAIRTCGIHRNLLPPALT